MTEFYHATPRYLYRVNPNDLREVVELAVEDDYYENIVEYGAQDDDGNFVNWHYAIVRWRYGNPTVLCQWMTPHRCIFVQE